MTLKTKISYGLGGMFFMITAMGVMGSYFLQKSANTSVKVLNENFTTIGYTREMSQAVNEMIMTLTLENSGEEYRNVKLRKATDKFNTYLNLQMAKMAGEKEKKLTAQLKEDFGRFAQEIKDMPASNEVSTNLFMQQLSIQGILEQVYDINNKIIKQRTDQANRTARKVTLVMVIAFFIFFISATSALLLFPNYIVRPVENLIDGLKEVTKKNYSTRLEITSSDEFGVMASTFNMMARKLEIYESVNMAQVLIEKKRIDAIVSRMNEAIIGLDDRKIILFANPPALELTGLQEDELIGKSASALLHQNGALESLLKEIVHNEVNESRSFPAVSIDRKGKRQYYNKDILRIKSLGNDESGPTNSGYVVILMNVTELKEQDLAKTNFMATLSHELKTPISAIDMSLNLLEDNRIGDLNEEQKDLSGTIRQNAARILKMVNEILDISRIETGNLQLNFENSSPGEVVARALDNVKTFVVDKKIKVIKTIEPNLPNLTLDIHKTNAVLVNFLTNAVRYTAENDSIEINVLRQNGSVHFTVLDHGPGISKEEQRKLFQPYRRAKGDNTKGTGLGLAISKEFVEAQGGKIWMESTVGKGSKFSFSLPVS